MCQRAEFKGEVSTERTDTPSHVDALHSPRVHLQPAVISLFGSRKEPFHLVVELAALRATRRHGSDAVGRELCSRDWTCSSN